MTAHLLGRMACAWAALTFACLLYSNPGTAHEVRPAYLEVMALSDGSHRVTWKQPLVGESGIALRPVMSGGWLTGKPQVSRTPAYVVLIWKVPASAPPLTGQIISVDGLER